MPYYPKLLVGVPFTPAEGARVLIDPSLTPDTMKNIRKAVGVFLRCGFRLMWLEGCDMFYIRPYRKYYLDPVIGRVVHTCMQMKIGNKHVSSYMRIGEM